MISPSSSLKFSVTASTPPPLLLALSLTCDFNLVDAFECSFRLFLDVSPTIAVQFGPPNSWLHSATLKQAALEHLAKRSGVATGAESYIYIYIMIR